MDVDSIMKKLAETTEKRRALERELAEAHRLIDTKTRELQTATSKDISWRREQQEAIEAAYLRVRELEKRTALQRLQEEDLQLEADSLRKRRGGSTQYSSLYDSQLNAVSTPSRTATTNSAVMTSSTSKSVAETSASTTVTSAPQENNSILHPIQLQSTLNQLLSLVKSLTNSDTESSNGQQPALATASGSNSSGVLSSVSSQPFQNLSAAMSSLITNTSAATAALKPNFSLSSQNVAASSQLPAAVNSSVAPIVPPPYPFQTANGVQLLIAKYNYSPFEQSPNEHPELEVPLRVGEYLLVRGEADEDGFYVGELISDSAPRRGLVPSNFVARVPDEDLPNAIATLIRNAPNCAAENLTTLLDCVRNQQMQLQAGQVLAPPAQFALASSASTNTPLALANATNQNGSQSLLSTVVMGSASKFDINSLASATGSDATQCVPAPTGIQVERQLANAVVVGWQPVEGAQDVAAYHVFVNGQFRTSVKAGDKSRVLLDNIDLTRAAYRINVRSVASRGQSNEAECTLYVGVGATLAPSNLTASSVTATSARLSWLPANSNCAHIVLLNGNVTSARVCRPGTYKLTLTGLQADSIQRVVVRARRVTGPLQSTPLSFGVAQFQAETDASIDFCTLPGGIPEPPLDVHATATAHDSLLVCWTPVGIPGNAGYRVYIDGRRVKQIDNPSADRAVLESELVRFHFSNANPPQFITVRTFLTDQRESTDSNTVRIPSGCFSNTSMVSLAPNVNLAHSAVGDYATVRRPIDASRATPVNNRPGMPVLDESPTNAYGFLNPPESPLLSPRSLPGTSWRDHYGLSAVDIDLNNDPFGANSLYAPLSQSRTQTWDGNRTAPPRGAGFNPSVYGSHAYAQNRYGQSGPMSLPPNQYGAAPNGAYGTLTSATQISIGAPYGPYGSQRYGPAVGPNMPGRNSHDDLELAARMRNSHAHYRAGKPPRGNRLSRSSSENRPDLGESPSNEFGVPFLPNDRPELAQLDQRDRATLPRSASTHRNVPLAQAQSQPQMPPQMQMQMQSQSQQVPRMLVALFDYDPSTMSPNPDAAEVELAFREGDIIRLLGGPDADGFLKGELDGCVGLVPSNMVTELQEEQAANRRGSGGQMGVVRRDQSRQPFGAPQNAEQMQRRAANQPGMAKSNGQQPQSGSDGMQSGAAGVPQINSNRPGPRPGQVGQFPASRNAGQQQQAQQNQVARQYDSAQQLNHPAQQANAPQAAQYAQSGQVNNQHGAAQPPAVAQQSATAVCPARRRANLDQLVSAPIKKAAALVDCNPPAGQPIANAVDLAFKEGDLLTLYGEAFEDGFFYAEHATSSKRGWVQAAQVRIYYDAAKKQLQKQMESANGRQSQNAVMSPTASRSASQQQLQPGRAAQARVSDQSAMSGGGQSAMRQRPVNGAPAAHEAYENERDMDRSLQKRIPAQRGMPPNSADPRIAQAQGRK